jgi:hypothetical protein
MVRQAGGSAQAGHGYERPVDEQPQRSDRARGILHKVRKNGHLSVTEFYRMRRHQRYAEKKLKERYMKNAEKKLKERYVNSVLAHPGKRVRTRRESTTPPPRKRPKAFGEENTYMVTEGSPSREDVANGIVCTSLLPCNI